MTTLKSNIATDSSQVRDFGVRVVVKCRKIPSSEPLDEFFVVDEIARWLNTTKASGQMDISRLFQSLKPVEINELVHKATTLDHTYLPADFLNYYAINCPDEFEAQKMLKRLLTHEKVELGYLIHDSAPPQSAGSIPQESKIPQGYLGPAPIGIDAQYAWNVKGGDGEGHVKFVDIEQGWILDHESLRVQTFPCTGLNYAFHDHGAAVLGIVMMKERAGKGITPNAQGYVVSQWRDDGSLNNADAIIAAIAQLQSGDIILLQAQVRDSTFRKNLWPVECHEATFQCIRLAKALGIIVIESAGNGSALFNLSNDLDDFESDGQKILNRVDVSFRDSGAIMVAAATANVPHQRRHNSNFGSRIDCYAWGENVATVGSFPNSSGGATDRYTDQFCGTSSAAAIIAGVAIAVQCIAEAKYGFRFSPPEMRAILSSKDYGTQSANGHAIDKIGVMPNLKTIIDEALSIVAGKYVGDCISVE